jgi:hypothetical protein
MHIVLFKHACTCISVYRHSWVVVVGTLEQYRTMDLFVARCRALTFQESGLYTSRKIESFFFPTAPEPYRMFVNDSVEGPLQISVVVDR